MRGQINARSLPTYGVPFLVHLRSNWFRGCTRKLSRATRDGTDEVYEILHIDKKTQLAKLRQVYEKE